MYPPAWAIINADSLLHDMNVFKERTSDFYSNRMSMPRMEWTSRRKSGNALMHYLIIFLLRSCRLVSSQNRHKLHIEIEKIVTAKILEDCFVTIRRRKAIAGFCLGLNEA